MYGLVWRKRREEFLDKSRRENGDRDWIAKKEIDREEIEAEKKTQN
jgi:hypothetical protein